MSSLDPAPGSPGVVTMDAAAIQRLIEEAHGLAKSDLAEALECLGRAAERARQQGMPRLEASARYERGCLLRRSGTPEQDQEAMGELHRALELHHELGDLRGQVRALFELGLHSFQSSDLASAIPLLYDAERLCRRTGQLSDLADVYEVLGGVYYTMGDFSSALAYSERALEIAVRTGDARRRIHGLDALAGDEAALGRHAQAQARFEQCLAEIRQLGGGRERAHLEAVALADWSEALCMAGEWAQAEELGRQSAHIARELGNKGLLGQALYCQGLAMVGNGGEGEAEQALLESHALYLDVRNKFYRSKVEKALSGIYRRRGDHRRALEYLEMAQDTDAAMRRDAAMHHSAHQRASERIDALRREKDAAERALFKALPDPIARRILGGTERIADEVADASILFADVVGFTQMAARMRAGDLLELLDRIFSRFDLLAERHALVKIKTIGDAFMAAGGVPEPSDDHLERSLRLALSMQEEFAEINQAAGTALSLRIGVHAGPVVAGVIGSARLAYDLWGDTVNVASRLESGGEPGRIQVSSAVRDRMRTVFSFRARGKVALKGLGELETYFLEGELV